MTNSEIRSPFRGRGFITAAIIIAVIVIAAIVVLVGSIARGGNAPAATPTTTPTAVPTTSTADRSICGLTKFDTTNTLTTAPATTWALVGTVAAPTDPKGTGPGTTDSVGFRSCFEHTAQGALFAAANMLAMGSDARLQPLLAEKLTVPGAGRDAAMRAAATSTQIRYQIAGYQIRGYNKDQATVDLAVTVSTGQTASVPFLVRWTDGDLNAVLTDSGDPPLASAPLQNLGGYTPWFGA